MSIVPASMLKQFSWSSPDGRQRGTFRPNPNTIKYGYKIGRRRYAVRNNPELWRSKGPTYSANLFVGFSIRNKPKWKMIDLVKLVKRIRIEQVGHPDSSFIYQKGVYTHQSDGMIVTEDAAQVVLLNVDPVYRKRSVFRQNVVDLAEKICRELKQETVIIRIDKNGIAEETVGISGDALPKKEKKAKKS